MKTLIASLVVLSALFAQADAESVTGVTAKQRWPWNGIVDVDFTLSGKAGEQYRIEVGATSAKSGTFFAKTYLTEPVMAAGQHRISWDFGRDYPNVRENDVVFSVAAFPLSEDDKPTYMVIDISAGKDAANWPVRYTSVPPQHTPGCLADKCKLSEIWLRRVHVKDEPFCYRIYTNGMGANNFFAKLTQDFYIAIFPTTQRQWYLMSGAYKSKFVIDRETRPVDSFHVNALWSSFSDYLNGNGTGAGGAVKDSNLDRIRIRTGLNTIDFPTEAQWVYALHNGPCVTETYRYRDATGYQYTFNECSRNKDNSGTVTDMATADLNNGTASVGCYAPNVIGLYDMVGNVGELVKNPQRTDAALKTYYDNLGATYPVLNPAETTTATAASTQFAICYPHGWRDVGGKVTTWWTRYGARADYCPDNGVIGFRFCVTVK